MLYSLDKLSEKNPDLRQAIQKWESVLRLLESGANIDYNSFWKICSFCEKFKDCGCCPLQLNKTRRGVPYCCGDARIESATAKIIELGNHNNFYEAAVLCKELIDKMKQIVGEEEKTSKTNAIPKNVLLPHEQIQKTERIISLATELKVLKEKLDDINVILKKIDTTQEFRIAGDFIRLLTVNQKSEGFKKVLMLVKEELQQQQLNTINLICELSEEI